MKPKDRRVTFPRMGNSNSEVIGDFLRDLGLDVVMPPRTTDETIRRGSKYCANMACFTEDTLITSNNFLSKEIKSIKKGDLVLTHKGRFRKVVQTMNRDYDGEIFNINCGGLLKFKVTPEHPIFALNKNQVRLMEFLPSFIEVKDLRKGDFIAIPVSREIEKKNELIWNKEYTHNCFKYENKKINFNKDILRLLGYWLAEGSIIYNQKKGEKKTAGLSFSFSSKEKEYIEDVKKILRDNFNCSVSERVYNERKTAYEILVYSKSLADIFLHLCNEKSDKKIIHPYLLFLEPNLQLELIKGFFRGDGSFNTIKRDNRYTLATVSPNLANQIFWLLIRNYIKPELGKRNPKNRKVAYFIRLWNGYINKLEIAKLKKTRKTSRKVINTEDYILIPIKEIKKEKFNGKVYNLAVEEDNSYVANFMAVHNCFPLKITLGNYLDAIDKGANTLLAYDTQGVCRFRQYSLLHEYILTSLGYDFEMITLNPRNIVGELSKLSGRNRLTVLSKIIKHYKNLKRNDSKSQEWSKDKPNIGIIGEIFCCVDNKANQGLEEKIRSFGANPYNTATTTDFVRDKIPLFSGFGLVNLFKKDELAPYKKEAEKYMGGWRAGHAFQNLYNLLWLRDKGVDGVVHVLPLSCCPETTIEPYIDGICRKSRIPLLRFPIDENSAEKNLETRIEVFTDLLKMRKMTSSHTLNGGVS